MQPFTVESYQGDPFAKPVYIEQEVLWQLHRISDMRSTGQSWSKALSQLRSLVVGLETDSFRASWRALSVDAVDIQGRILEIPSEEQNSERLNLLLSLLADRGITWKRKTISKTGQAAFDSIPEES